MADSIIIDPVQKNDDAGVFRLIDTQRLRLQTYFPVTCGRCRDVRGTRAYLKEMVSMAKAREFFCFVLRDYEGSEPIGLLFLREFDHDLGKCEIAYLVHANYEGKGYATLAVCWGVDHAFTTLRMQKVYARVLPDNMASWKVLENCGFQRDGVLRQDHRLPTGEVVDVYLYSVLR